MFQIGTSSSKMEVTNCDLHFFIYKPSFWLEKIYFLQKTSFMAKSKAVVKIPDEIIMNQIYYIREQKAMLDGDLAILYGVETKVLNLG